MFENGMGVMDGMGWMGWDGWDGRVMSGLVGWVIGL